ncbi:winged helix-turn-helix domain-containing protein [Anoxybacillus sp. ST4]|nr:winged helix-turn-helix domain-containing protein [Anoxybacillus sp. ST4]
MLHRLGLSYTKPTYTLAKTDEEKQKKFIENIFLLICIYRFIFFLIYSNISLLIGCLAFSS